MARPFRPEELAIVQTSLTRLTALYQSHPDQADRAAHGRRIKRRSVARAGDSGRLDHAGQRIDESG